MKNYLINEKQLKRILEQVEDEENDPKDEETNDENVSSGFFDDITKKPIDSSDPLKIFFDSLN
jgi:hypothetical protein